MLSERLTAGPHRPAPVIVACSPLSGSSRYERRNESRNFALHCTPSSDVFRQPGVEPIAPAHLGSFDGRHKSRAPSDASRRVAARRDASKLADLASLIVVAGLILALVIML